MDDGPWGRDRGAGRKSDRRTMSQRQLKVAELLRQALSEVLSRETIRDPVVAQATITVTEVQPAPDLKLATCYVMPLGGANAAAIIEALTAMAPWLSSKVAHRVSLKNAPKLRFRLDQSFDQAGRIDALLRRANVNGKTATEAEATAPAGPSAARHDGNGA